MIWQALGRASSLFHGPCLPRPWFSTSAKPKPGKLEHVNLMKRMMPLIKRIHPDMFAQSTATVRSTNEKSLMVLNTVVDACQSKINAISGRSASGRELLARKYTLKFYMYKLSARTGADQCQHHALKCFQCKLRFPSDLWNNRRSGNEIYRHILAELDSLLIASGLQPNVAVKRADQPSRKRAPMDHDPYAGGRAAGKDGLYTVRGREQFDAKKDYITAAEVYSRVHHDACKWSSGKAVEGRRQHVVEGYFSSPLEPAIGRLVHDFLTCGRVLSKDVGQADEVAAMRRMHSVMTNTYRDLRLDDLQLWGKVVFILTSKNSWQVKGTPQGIMVQIPGEFDDAELEDFLLDLTDALLRDEEEQLAAQRREEKQERQPQHMLGEKEKSLG